MLDSSPHESMLTLGKISGVFGVKGWVKIYSHTAPIQKIISYSPLYLKKRQTWDTITIINGHKQGKGVVAQLEGINDRDQAFTLIGMELGIQRDQLSDLASDHYYWTDLEGLNVVTTDNAPLGKIAWLFETGSNDVMVVKGEKEHLIPWIQGDIVKSVDLDNATVCVEWDTDF